MKAALVIASLLIGSYANAGLFDTTKSQACWKRLARMPGANVLYKCEFGKIVEIRNESHGGGGNGGNGGGGRGCHGGRN